MQVNAPADKFRAETRREEVLYECKILRLHVEDYDELEETVGYI